MFTDASTVLYLPCHIVIIAMNACYFHSRFDVFFFCFYFELYTSQILEFSLKCHERSCILQSFRGAQKSPKIPTVKYTVLCPTRSTSKPLFYCLRVGYSARQSYRVKRRAQLKVPLKREVAYISIIHIRG